MLHILLDQRKISPEKWKRTRKALKYSLGYTAKEAGVSVGLIKALETGTIVPLADDVTILLCFYEARAALAGIKTFLR